MKKVDITQLERRITDTPCLPKKYDLYRHPEHDTCLVLGIKNRMVQLLILLDSSYNDFNTLSECESHELTRNENINVYRHPNKYAGKPDKNPDLYDYVFSNGDFWLIDKQDNKKLIITPYCDDDESDDAYCITLPINDFILDHSQKVWNLKDSF